MGETTTSKHPLEPFGILTEMGQTSLYNQETVNFLHRNASRGRRRRQADNSGILNGDGPILSLLNNIFGSNRGNTRNRGLIFGSRGNRDNSFRLFPAPVVTGGNGGFNLIPAPRGRSRRQAVENTGVLNSGPIFGFLNGIVRSVNEFDGFDLIPGTG